MLKSARMRRGVTLAVVVIVAAFAAVLHLRPGGAFVVRAIDDVTEAAAAAVGALPCFWRARRTSGRWRLSWLLLGAALASWAIGQTIWSYYELISSQETPFPSWADVGFLLFPLLALPGLLIRPSTAFVGRGRFRVLLDGTMVVGSLLVVSWSTVLGAVYAAGAQSTLALVVSLAYPASDVLLITVAVLVGARSRASTGLLLLVGGLIAMAVGDSAFSYMTAAGTYHTGAFSDLAWVAAFLFIGVSALYPRPVEKEGAAPVESPLSVALPYVLVLVGVVAEVIALVRDTVAPVSLAAAGIALLALVVRQFLTLLDNRRLALDVLAQQAELRYRAFHDALTGVANRALFYDRLTHALELHKRDMRPVSVVFVDLDDFKAVNDSYGHDVGDAVLVAIAGRLTEVVRTGDTLARLGGDEFAVLLEDDGDAELLAGRLQRAFAEPVAAGGRLLPVRASIGTTTLDPGDAGTDVRELLKRADLAMYAAKRGGKGASVAYTPELNDHADHDLDRRLTLTEDIRAGRVRTVYQPIVWADGASYGIEALARWRYRGASVSPELFIPIADRCGLLPELDMQMMYNALSQVGSRPTRERVLVSVNIGLRNADPAMMAARVDAALAEFGLDSSSLVVEVSEREAFADPRTVHVLTALREIGLSIAIDDFGTGYSNLARLGELQPEIVKIDRSFVEPLDTPGASTKLLAGVIGLAHELGATVIGEGVETQAQLDILRGLDCDALQGFLIGRPSLAPWERADVLDVA